jgi:hypothetical protein
MRNIWDISATLSGIQRKWLCVRDIWIYTSNFRHIYCASPLKRKRSNTLGQHFLDPVDVRSTARHTIHLQFDISPNFLEIKAVHRPKCIVWCAVDYVCWLVKIANFCSDHNIINVLGCSDMNSLNSRASNNKINIYS